MRCWPVHAHPADVWVIKVEDAYVLRFLSRASQKWAVEFRPDSSPEVVESSFLWINEEDYIDTMHAMDRTSFNVLFDEGDYHA